MLEHDGWLVFLRLRYHCLALSLQGTWGDSQPTKAWQGSVTRSRGPKTSRSFHPRGREMVALAEAHQVANVHISSLLGVFLTPELNPVWNDRLVEQRLLYLNGIRHAYQVYEMPCANNSH